MNDYSILFHKLNACISQETPSTEKFNTIGEQLSANWKTFSTSTIEQSGRKNAWSQRSGCQKAMKEWKN